MDERGHLDTRFFDDVLDSFNLSNSVTFPAHKAGHTLDLLIHDVHFLYIGHIEVGHMLSNHSFIHCKLHISRPCPTSKRIKVRKTKNIDPDSFARDVATVMGEIKNLELDEMIDCYNSVLAELLDKHAPAEWKEIKVRHNQPWFLDRIKEEIRLHRWKERCWRSDNTEYNYRAFYNQR